MADNGLDALLIAPAPPPGEEPLEGEMPEGDMSGFGIAAEEAFAAAKSGDLETFKVALKSAIQSVMFETESEPMGE